MIEAFGVKNLRCLTDTRMVELKPITLLVGRNSSGKSTFLRALPLLRQSMQSRRRSPILWSDPEFVDFGSFETSVNEQNRDGGITFAFRARMVGRPEAFVGEPTCELSMTLASAESGVYVRAYDLEIAGTRIRMTFGPDRRATSLEIGDRDMLPEGGIWLGGSATLIASIDAYEDAQLAYSPFIVQDPTPSGVSVPFARPLIEALKASPFHLSGGVEEQLAFTLPVGTQDEMIAAMRDHLVRRGVTPASVDPEVGALRTLCDLVLLARLPLLLGVLDWSASVFAFGVRYLGPQRSVGARQYVQSEITVDEILPRGENLPQFLAALDPGQMDSLAAFTLEHLGFETMVRKQGLYIEILIKQIGAREPQNIADVGFGYAEVLPLCVSLWWQVFRYGAKRPTSVLALEQPELHLHPAHQARLARLFVGAVKQNRQRGDRSCLVVETHSEAVVNGLGALVREKRIDANDIQILVFDQNRETGETEIEVAGYAATGALKNWPFGFLAPIAERLEDIARAAAEE